MGLENLLVRVWALIFLGLGVGGPSKIDGRITRSFSSTATPPLWLIEQPSDVGSSDPVIQWQINRIILYAIMQRSGSLPTDRAAKRTGDRATNSSSNRFNGLRGQIHFISLVSDMSRPLLSNQVSNLDLMIA